MQRMADAAREMLAGRIVPFWLKLRDESYGGFYGLMDHSLTLRKTAEKGTILNSRILWFFSECTRESGRKDLKDAAEHAYRFLRDSCLDRNHGGFYWSVDHQGKKLDGAKHTYCQAFALYGLSAYSRMSGNEEAAALAMRLFRLIEEKCFDGEGYLEAFTEDWQQAPNGKLSGNGVEAERTMNTLLHVFEAYSELFLISGDECVGHAMRRILDIYSRKVYDPDRKSLKVFFDRGYHPLIDLYSYGHDIEASWLVDRGTALLGDEELTSQIRKINTCLAENVFAYGLDGDRVLTEKENGIPDPWFVWWVQAEAVTGFLNEWEKHPDKTKFAVAAADVFHYIEREIIDRRPEGEWFWRVDANGQPDVSMAVVEPWKCRYHNGRMCLEIMRRDPEIYV